MKGQNTTQLADYLNPEELETMAACFDYIREMRRQNPKMVDNDDNSLANQFDEQLSLMIGHLTDALQNLEGPDAQFNRGKLALQGK